MTCQLHPERPEFGCERCIRLLHARQRQAELESAPLHRVTFEWSETINVEGDFTIDVRIPPSWSKDDVDRLLQQHFECHVAAELTRQLDEARSRALSDVEPHAVLVGPVVEVQRTDQPSLLLDGGA